MPAPTTLIRLSTVAFLAALMVLTTLVAVALHETQRLGSTTRETLHARDVLTQSSRVLQLITDTETSGRGYAITGEPQFLDPYERAVRELPGASSRLAQLVGDNPEQRQRIATLLPLLDSRLTHIARVIQTRRSTGLQAAQELIRTGYGRDVMERIRKLFAELDAVEETLLKARLDEGQRHASSSRVALLLPAAVALILLAAGWLLTRRAIAHLNTTQALAHLEGARMRATLQSCGDALIVTDETGKVIMMNPIAETLTGWRQDQANGLPLDGIFRIVKEFSRDAVENPVSRVLREGKVAGLANHTLLLARDGTERPIDDSGAPIKDQNGDTVGVVLVFRDVTSRKLSELARERLLRAEAEREAAVSANQAKDQFLALVSHELRSPLSAIRGWLHLLEGGLLPQHEVRGALQRIYRNTRLQERLIGDLLDISRIIAGKLEVIRSPVDLVEIAQAAIDECRPVAEQKGVNLSLERCSVGLFVLGDEHRLVQSIGNIVANGIKFTNSGGSVIVRVERGGSKAVVTVRDTGIGMSSEALGRLFERFWQADSSKTREYSGLGLGLAITKHLIEEHEGTIRAASAGVGSGSAFTIELPVLEVGTVEINSPVVRPESSKDLADIRILLVDDDEDSRVAIQILLQARGAEVAAAASVQAAINAYESELPTVVVTDVGMPIEDGYSLVKEIRAREAPLNRRTPMIAVTGFASPGDLQEALNRDFDAHLAKPVDPEQLIARIRALVKAP